MEKKRMLMMDNIKCLMIFCVVFGHLLESYVGNNAVRTIYVIIYCFHIPIFAYCTGYFAKFDAKKIRDKILYPYIVFQILYIIFMKCVIHQDGVKFQFTTPCWLMWYIFAIMIWKILLPIFDVKTKKRQMFALFASIILMLYFGYDNQVGYFMSMSRIISFFPFFLLAFYQRKNFSYDELLRLKSNKIFKLFIGIIFIALIVYLLYYNYKFQIPWLYESYSYESGGYSLLIRLCLLIFAIIGIAFCVAFVPDKKIPFLTNIGKNSIYVYLLHGFLVKTITYYGFLKNFGNIIVACFFTAIIITVVLSSKYIALVFEPFVSFPYLYFNNKFKNIKNKINQI